MNFSFLLPLTYNPPKKEWPNKPDLIPNPEDVCAYIVRGSFVIYETPLFNDDGKEVPNAMVDLLLRFAAYTAATGNNFLIPFARTSDKELEEYTTRKRALNKTKDAGPRSNIAYAARGNMMGQLVLFFR